MTQFHDGLTNELTGLGDTNRDKLAATGYATATEKPRTHWGNLARSSGTAGRIVSMPAEDATREWREWSAESADISLIEAEENRLGISGELKMALEDQRSVGRGFVYFDLGDDPAEPVNPKRVKRGGVRFTRYIEEGGIIDGDIEDDPMSDGYGHPKWYEIATTGTMQRIHPSRLIRLNGERILGYGGYQRRYDGVLRRCETSIVQYDAVKHNIAALTYEAKIDVWSIPNLSRILSDPVEGEAFRKAVAETAASKSMYGMLTLEGGDPENKTTYDQKKVSFATLPDIMSKFEDAVCSVAGFSKDYLFARDTGGLGDNGQSVLEMDYGKIAQIQKTVIDPALSIFNECLIRSALGARPDDVFYTWRSLWSMSDADRAKIGLDIANRYKAIADADLLPVDVMSAQIVNELTEKAGAQGLEAAYAEFVDGGGLDDDDDISDDDLSMVNDYMPQVIAPPVDTSRVLHLVADALEERHG